VIWFKTNCDALIELVDHALFPLGSISDRTDAYVGVVPETVIWALSVSAAALRIPTLTTGAVVEVLVM
ncbi:hypothetical protein P0E65_14235, partial [Enterococcus faecalis]|uniref:hypothetical protein n=1 Tax=Enterococcus faecalis TaxID=1351 RepID=UPI0025B0F3BB